MKIYMFPCPVCKNRYGKKVGFHIIKVDRKRGFKVRCMVCGTIKSGWKRGKTMNRAMKEDGN